MEVGDKVEEAVGDSLSPANGYRVGTKRQPVTGIILEGR
jgi:hypothetical protein